MNPAAAITVLAVVLSCGTLLAGRRPVPIEDYLEKRYSQLAAVKEPSAIKGSKLAQLALPVKEGPFLMSAESGFLGFPDGSWVLLASHSVHAEDGLPDVSLIRTSTGDFYYNLGHCCLPIQLFSKEKVVSLDVFLRTTGLGTKAEPTPWIKYVREQAGADQPATAPEPKSEGDEKLQPESKPAPR